MNVSLVLDPVMMFSVPNSLTGYCTLRKQELLPDLGTGCTEQARRLYNTGQRCRSGHGAGVSTRRATRVVCGVVNLPLSTLNGLMDCRRIASASVAGLGT